MATKRDERKESHKKAFLEAMEKTYGNVTESCKAIGIHRTLPYKWCDADPEFKKKFETTDWEEMFLDMIEAQLASLAVKKNPTVLIFLAKTKGRKRGYSEQLHIKTEEVISDKERELRIQELIKKLET